MHHLQDPDAAASAQVYDNLILLAQHLYTGLSNLKHFNRQPLCQVYADYSGFAPSSNPKSQRATIAFNVLYADGSYVDCSNVLNQATKRGMAIQTSWLPMAVQIEGMRYDAATVTATLDARAEDEDVDEFLAHLLEAFIARSEKEAVVSRVELKEQSPERGVSPISPSRSPPRRTSLED